MPIYIVEGGIGHALNSTFALRAASEIGREKAIVLSVWPEVFEHNPDVKIAYHISKDVDAISDLYRQYHGRYIIYKDNIYSERFHLRYPTLHLKHLIAMKWKLPGILGFKDLYFYPTQTELESVKAIYDEAIKPYGESIFGIYQPEGSGIGGNPAAPLKGIPVSLSEGILDGLPENVFLFHIRLPKENPIKHKKLISIELKSIRELVIFARYCSFGIGCESVMNHIMAGLYHKRFITLFGRSNPFTYAHHETVILREDSSCPYIGCEMPFYPVERICNRAVCMDAITPSSVLEKLDQVLTELG